MALAKLTGETNLRTCYSFKQAAGNIEDYISRIKECGWTNAPIIDTASTFGFVVWQDACKKNGLKPVYGLELSVTDMIGRKKPIVDSFQFIAIDSVVPLFKLLQLATNQFRYQPMLTYDQVNQINGVNIITGYKTQLDKLTPRDNVFVGLSVASTRAFIDRSLSLGFKLAARQENRYPGIDDSPVYTLVCRADHQTYAQHVISDEEFKSMVGEHAQEALNNRDKIYDASNAVLPKGSLVHPNCHQTLREQCEEGAKRLGINISTGPYQERLDYELSIIEQRNFTDYFFLVGELMRYIRSQKLCGPGRGSSAGSLVCLLIGITNVDPLKHGLIFERFLSMDRVGELPDCDLDVSEDARNLAFSHLKEVYGHDHVAQIGSVSLFKEDAILDELGKIFGVSKFECKEVLQEIEPYAVGDKSAAKVALENLFNNTERGKRFLKKYPEMRYATLMSSHPRHKTRHAAGVIVADKPIVEYLGYDETLGGLHANKEDVESLGHCKIDLLGLTQLSIFEMALSLAHLPVDTLDKLDFNDQKAFDVLNDKKFSGIFQFAGRSLQRLTEQVHVTDFEDLVALTSLARPGPLDSGGANRWVDCKNGKQEPSYIHESLIPILESTAGVITYQEQLMRIVREIGNLSWEKVTKFRRAVSKSKGYDALREFEDEFRVGAASHGWTQDQIDHIWNELVTFGKYGFCRAHAVAYSMISYHSMWLKAYYPKEYAAAILQYQTDADKQLAVLRELAKEGITYVPFDPELSTDKWTVREGRLIGPIQNVIGIGPKVVNQILSARARNEPLPTKIVKKLQDVKTKLDNLNPIRAKVLDMGLEAKSYYSRIVDIGSIELTGEWQREVYVCGLVTKVVVRDENEPKRIEDRLSRGDVGKKEGETRFVEIRVTDDSGTFFVKIGSKDFEKRGIRLTEALEVDKSYIVAFGTIPPSAPVLLCSAVWILKEKEE